MGEKMPFTIFKYLFLFQRYASLKNIQFGQGMTSFDVFGAENHQHIEIK